VRDKHFRFHKVVKRHYSGEVGNVYIILQQIYSRNFVPNLIRIARVFSKILQKEHFGLFSPDILYLNKILELLWD